MCSRLVGVVRNLDFLVLELKKQATELNLPRSSARIFMCTLILVFGAWSECDRQPHAAEITGPSRQFFEQMAPTHQISDLHGFFIRLNFFLLSTTQRFRT